MSSGKSDRRSAFVLGGAVVSMVTVILGVVRGKATAHFVGPDGFGLIAEVAQVVSLSLFASQVAVHTPLIRAMSRAVHSSQPDELDAAFSAPFWVTAVIHGIGALVGLGLAYSVLPSAALASLGLAVLLSVVATWATTTNTIANQYFIAVGEARSFVVAAVLGSVVATVVSVALVALLGVMGQFWALAVGNLFVLAVAGVYLRRRLTRWPALVPLKKPPGFLRDVFKLGGAALLSSLALQLLMSWTRLRVGAVDVSASARLNGFFQAAWAIAGTYLATALQGHNAFFNVRFAGCARGEELRDALDEAVVSALRYLSPVVLGGIALSQLAIRVIYTREFLPAAHTLELLLAFAPLRIVAWNLSSVLMLRGHVVPYLVSEAVALLAGLAGVYLLAHHWAVEGAAVGLSVPYVLIIPLLAWLVHEAEGVQVGWRAFMAMALLLATALGAVVLFSAVDSIWLRLVLVGLAAVVAFRTGVVAEFATRLRKR